MCLAAPCKVSQVKEQEAIVELGGVKRRIRLDTLPEELKPGDYVLVHTGFAIRKIPPHEAEKTLQLFDEFIEANQELAQEPTNET